MNPASVKMMDYFARKAKKLQTRRHVEDGPPVLAEEDANYLARAIAADGAPPPLPARPFGPTVGDYEDNILQMVLYDSATAEVNSKATTSENADKKTRKKKEEKTARLTKDETAELEKLVDEVREQTREQSMERGKGKEKAKPDEKKSSRLASLLGRKRKGSEPSTPVPEEVEKEAEDLEKILEDLDLSSTNNRAFSFTKSSQGLIREFSFILKDLMNGAPTAYDDLTTLLEDKDNALNKSYKQLPTFLQKLIAGVPKKVEAKAMGALNEAQTSVGAKPSESGAGMMNIAQSFLGVATLKQLITAPGGVKGMLATIMNALKLRFPAFLGTNVLMSLGVFILLFTLWYCHKRGREERLGKDKALLDSEGDVLVIEGGKGTRSVESESLRDRRNSDGYTLSSVDSRNSRSYASRSDDSQERKRGERRSERRGNERRREINPSDTLTAHGSNHPKPDESVSSLSETDSEYVREGERRRARRRERRQRQQEREQRFQNDGGERSLEQDRKKDRDSQRDKDGKSERRSDRDRQQRRDRHRDEEKDRDREEKRDRQRRKEQKERRREARK